LLNLYLKLKIEFHLNLIEIIMDTEIIEQGSSENKLIGSVCVLSEEDLQDNDVQPSVSWCSLCS